MRLLPVSEIGHLLIESTRPWSLQKGTRARLPAEQAYRVRPSFRSSQVFGSGQMGRSTHLGLDTLHQDRSATSGQA